MTQSEARQVNSKPGWFAYYGASMVTFVMLAALFHKRKVDLSDSRSLDLLLTSLWDLMSSGNSIDSTLSEFS